MQDRVYLKHPAIVFCICEDELLFYTFHDSERLYIKDMF
jgi:hypothetical protein